MVHVSSEHLLVQGVDGPPCAYIPSQRYGFLDAGGLRGVVWHWTGSLGKTDRFATNLAASIQSYDPAKDVAASWHVLIARDGRLLQSVPFNKAAWHVGKAGFIGGKSFLNVNKVTVGIELENAGRLLGVGGKFYRWPWPYGRDTQPPPPEECQPSPSWEEVSPSRVVAYGGRFYDRFTDAQVASAQELVRALSIYCPAIVRETCTYGHVDFDPGRKADPGPCWQVSLLPGILDAVFRDRRTPVS